MNADVDCPYCGLGQYSTDHPAYPFCDEKCATAYEVRRATRSVKIDLFRWQAAARLDYIKERAKRKWRASMKMAGHLARRAR